MSAQTVQCPNCGYGVTVPEGAPALANELSNHEISRNEEGEIDCCERHDLEARGVADPGVPGETFD